MLLRKQVCGVGYRMGDQNLCVGRYGAYFLIGPFEVRHHDFAHQKFESLFPVHDLRHDRGFIQRLSKIRPDRME